MNFTLFPDAVNRRFWRKNRWFGCNSRRPNQNGLFGERVLDILGGLGRFKARNRPRRNFLNARHGYQISRAFAEGSDIGKIRSKIVISDSAPTVRLVALT